MGFIKRENRYKKEFGCEKMIEKTLSIAFGESIKDNTVGLVSDYAEIALDSVIEDGLLKDFPIISTVVALFKVGSSVIDRHNLKKLYIFLNETNKGIVTEEKREKYKEKFKSDDKFRNKEIEYLLVLINRYISYDKPQMLAKLYLAYLGEVIIWDEFAMYSEIIDRLLDWDYKFLIMDSKKITVPRNMVGVEAILRLVALGLMTEVTNKSLLTKEKNGSYSMTWEGITQSQSVDKVYKRTEFGEKLSRILR